jgi:hypothetical protein
MVVKPEGTSSRPVRVIGLLLLIQAIGLVGIIAYTILQFDWGQIEQIDLELIQPDSPQFELVLEVGKVGLVAIFFLPSIVLAIIGALGFLLFSRRGWLLASLAQTLNLAACLELYSDPDSLWSNPPDFIYPVMLYCILMILYLNSSAVRAVFHSRVSQQRPSERDLEAARDS